MITLMFVWLIVSDRATSGPHAIHGEFLEAKAPRKSAFYLKCRLIGLRGPMKDKSRARINSQPTESQFRTVAEQDRARQGLADSS